MRSRPRWFVCLSASTVRLLCEVIGSSCKNSWSVRTNCLPGIFTYVPGNSVYIQSEGSSALYLLSCLYTVHFLCTPFHPLLFSSNFLFHRSHTAVYRVLVWYFYSSDLYFEFSLWTPNHKSGILTCTPSSQHPLTSFNNECLTMGSNIVLCVGRRTRDTVNGKTQCIYWE